MRRQEFAARVWAKLVAFQKKSGLLAKGDRVLAAVSGGPDSVCLAHHLAEIRRRHGFELRLLHVHHGLRGREADRDAEFVRKLGKSLGLPVQVVSVEVKRRAQARGKGLEEAGRELRYAALREAARRQRCNKVATAHHLDDQAETVLLNLLRGTRLSALGGIPPRRPLGPNLELVRPLLAIRKSEVLAYLRVHGLKYRLDRSNLSERFTRNWLRRRVLPELETRQPRVREHLAGIAEQVRAVCR